jgi:hypothetical protein
VVVQTFLCFDVLNDDIDSVLNIAFLVNDNAIGCARQKQRDEVQSMWGVILIQTNTRT